MRGGVTCEQSVSERLSRDKMAENATGRLVNGSWVEWDWVRGAADLEVLKTNADAFFLVTMGIFVFFMQAGFAFLEAGAVR